MVFTFRFSPLALLLSSCTSGADNGNSANVHELDLGDPETCEVVIDGNELFVGTEQCLRKLEPKRLGGIWVLGHEYSTFYDGNMDRIPAPTYDDTWLLSDRSETLRQYGLAFDGKTRAYRVEFIGTVADRPGLYGHFGRYKNGALVLKMLSLQRLPDSWLAPRSVDETHAPASP